MSNRQKLGLYVAVFLAAYLVPLQHPRVQTALWDMWVMLQDYAREHVLFCLVPAFFIAGGIGVFLGKDAVMKYLGPTANKCVSYAVASTSGTILAVCSCTVLPLFAGIYSMGAGIGPATAFLYAGPAINVLAIILTARVLGLELGLARAVGAVIFGVLIGLLMERFCRQEEDERMADTEAVEAEDGEEDQEDDQPLWQVASFIGVMVLILIFAAWAKPTEQAGLWWEIFQIKWYIVIPLLGILGLMLWRWYTRDQIQEWLDETWHFTELIMPLLFAGVLAAGFLLGMPGTDHGIIPNTWIAQAVGGNSLLANFAASLVGALMYFATLTEIPILEGLLGSGMGKGPALALLLAGPALSLPNMLVIRSVLGTKKTLIFIAIVVVFSTIAGVIYGAI
ncbi:MAG: permease [Armatimonadota bacterium]